MFKFQLCQAAMIVSLSKNPNLQLLTCIVPHKSIWIKASAKWKILYISNLTWARVQFYRISAWLIHHFPFSGFWEKELKQSFYTWKYQLSMSTDNVANITVSGILHDEHRRTEWHNETSALLKISGPKLTAIWFSVSNSSNFWISFSVELMEFVAKSFFSYNELININI